jgi:hypothetical protein
MKLVGSLALLASYKQVSWLVLLLDLILLALLETEDTCAADSWLWQYKGSPGKLEIC